MKRHASVLSAILVAMALSVIVITSSLAVPADEGLLSEIPAEPLAPSVKPDAAALRYRIDPAKSSFTVRAFRSGLLKAFGHDHTIAVRDFSGEADITASTLTPASLQLNIKADSLAVTDKVSDDDRKEIENTMKTEVLETSKYPQITFKSTSIDAEKTGEAKFKVKIWGEITLHGKTGKGYIESQVTFSGNSMRATGGFSLKQSDYGIDPPSVAGGTIKVKDELKFTFDMVAVQQ